MTSANTFTQADKIVVLEIFVELHEHVRVAKEILDGNLGEEFLDRKDLPDIQEIIGDLDAYLQYYIDAFDAWEIKINSITTRSKEQEAKELQAWIDEDPRSRTKAGATISVKELKRKLAKLLRRKEPPRREQVEAQPVQEQSLITAHHEQALQRLPPPTLPTFAGIRGEYTAWWEQFQEMIHNRLDITKADKMRYLRQSIRDEAKVALSHLSATSVDYDIAIQLLHDTFSESKADSIMELAQLRSLRPTDTSWAAQLSLVTALKAVTAKLSRTQEGLQANTLMHQLILEKFPAKTRETLLRYMYDHEEITATMILSHAEQYIKREMFAITMTEKTTVSTKYQEPTKNYHINAGMELNRSAMKKQENYKARSDYGEVQACAYCSEAHLSWSCQKMWRIKDRIKFRREQGLCQGCLARGGTSHTCNSRCPLCSGPHDISTCFKLISINKVDKARKHSNEGKQPFNRARTNNNEDNQQRKGRRNQNVNTSSLHTSANTNYKPRLLTGRVQVRSKAGTEINYLLDSGASILLIDETLAEELQLQFLRSSEFTLCGLGGNTKGKRRYKMYNVPIITSDGGTMLIEAAAHPKPITADLDIEPLPQQDIDYMASKGIHLSGEGGSTTQVTPELLLGNTDFLRCVRWNQEIVHLPSGYLLMNTTLGWIATGARNGNFPWEHHCVSTVINSKRQETEALRKFLALDEAVKEGEDSESKNSTDQQDRVGCHFSENVEINESRIYTRYCIKEENMPQLSRNFDSSIARLRNVIDSLREKGLLQHYNDIILDYLKKGYIEEVPDSEIEGTDPTTYLPHHPVYRPEKPTKPIRIVFDASSKERGKLSLNDCMAEGVIQLEHIPALLIRARCATSIVTADVEAAFLQIKIQPDQRNLLRLLWVWDPDKPPGKNNLVTYRFTVTPFGISQSPYLLEASISHQVKICGNRQDVDEKQEFVLEQLKNNVYVDNILSECDETTDKKQLYKDSKEILAGISMNLREFASDDSAFISELPTADQGKIGEQKLLGVKWNSRTDNLHLLAEMPIASSLTKRVVLKKIATPFDPLGLLAPLLLPAKIFVQGLWKKDYGWDTKLEPEDANSWKRIEQDIAQFSIHRPRSTAIPSENWILAVFVDASLKALGASVYVVGNNRAEILISRSQLAPLRRTMTIPKLEFKAILLGLQLLTFAARSIRKSRKNVQISSYLFSDSQIALYWMTADQKGVSSRTVSNIKKKIKDTSGTLCEASHISCEGSCLRVGHVIGKENPADHATRGCSARKLQADDHIWWTGPTWLNTFEIKKKELWKMSSCTQDVIKEAEMEDRPLPVLIANTTKPPLAVIDFPRFSKLSILIRTTAYVRRFIHLMIRRSSTPRFDRAEKAGILLRTEPTKGLLTGQELKSAEWTVYRHYQNIHGVSEKDSGKDKPLHLYKDQYNVYRCGFSRLQNSNLPTTETDPIFIPGHHTEALIGMLIRKAHNSIKHAGHNHTMDFLRRKVWITRCRRAVRYWVSKCVTCRRYQALPFRYPPAPPLPKERIMEQRPFDSVGLDYAGPFTVRTKNELVKEYALIITCLASRAAHIEVTDSLSTISFINAFRRFSARRGTPHLVVCDNAPAFKCAQELWNFPSANSGNSNLVEDPTNSAHIRWKFITPHAPWQGGVYERLVGIMKNAMNRSFGNRILDADEFQTSMTEIEWIMNSRPLCHISDDPRDTWRIIRPIDLMIPGVSQNLPTLANDEDPNDPSFSCQVDSNLKSIARMINTHQKGVKLFWKIFNESYLKSLHGITRASHAVGRNGNPRKPEIGEIVLLKDENQSRGTWSLAKIEKLTERSAAVRTTTGRVVSRPLDHLIPLEIRSENTAGEVHETETVVDAPAGETRPQRSCPSLAKDPSFWRSIQNY